MTRAVILTISVVTLAGASQTPARSISMRDLTVPAERLPVGCALAPTPTMRLDGGRVRGGLWAEFPTNPWSGSDRRLTASIRQRVDGPLTIADGPPLDASALSRYLGQLADGIEEAYGAVYMQSATDLITVRAVRFAPNERAATGFPSDTTPVSANPPLLRVAIGPIVAIVNGSDGPCFRVVSTHLKSLVN